MKHKSVLFILLGIFILLIVISFIYIFKYRRTYHLNLPKLENLKSISLKQNINEKIISDNEKMKDILYILNGKSRNTKEQSISDLPVNTNNIIKIDFNFIEKGSSTIFVYTKNNKYYIEQPYNGIYKINQDEYNLIKNI